MANTTGTPFTVQAGADDDIDGPGGSANIPAYTPATFDAVCGTGWTPA